MYYTYMLRCEDQSIYTGITTDPDRRFSEHLSGSKKAAAYTRTHHAEKMIALWRCDSRSDACKLESAIKTLNKRQKESLVFTRTLLIFQDRLDITRYTWAFDATKESGIQHQRLSPKKHRK